MRHMVFGFFGHAMLNFAVFPLQAHGPSGANSPAAVWRGFLGHWMSFCSTALDMLFAAAAATQDRS